MKNKLYTDNKVSENSIASVSDRFLAFALDFLILSPIYFLILNPIIQKVQLKYYLEFKSLEFFIFFAVLCFSSLLLTIFFQFIFTYYWERTPGKYFFKLKIISLNKNSKDKNISWSQALLRAFLWGFQWILFLIPFLEIFSHPKRRPLHDRGSDTMVITLKEKSDEGPHLSESIFIHQFVVFLGFTFLVWLGLFLNQMYQMATNGDFKRNQLVESHYLCEEVTNSVHGRNENRVDLALSLFLAGQIQPICLLREADFSLWSMDEESKPWAYFAKGFLYYLDSDLKKSKIYFSKICSTNIKLTANLNEFFDNPFDNCLLRNFKKSITSDFLILKKSLSKDSNKFSQNLLFKFTKKHLGFDSFAQKELVRLFWNQGYFEKSYGAYENIFSYLDIPDQMELSSWLCLHEVERSCQNSKYLSCENLKENIFLGFESLSNSETALALVKEKECKNLLNKKINLTKNKQFINSCGNDCEKEKLIDLKISKIILEKNTTNLKRAPAAAFIKKIEKESELH